MIFELRKAAAGAASVLLLIACTNSLAHQQKEAYVTLLFNDRSSLLEISHRFSLHDAQHVLKALLGTQGDLATSKETQTLFVDYVAANFELRDGKGQVLGLAHVGHEVDAKYFWVYQQRAIPKVKSIQIKDTALFETWPSQINYVNVEKSNWVRSARLSKEYPYKMISLLD